MTVPVTPPPVPPRPRVEFTAPCPCCGLLATWVSTLTETEVICPLEAAA